MTVRFDDWEGEHLEHHGVRGMKWGVRRYQNEDGSLTPAGEKRYGSNASAESKGSLTRKYNSVDQVRANAVGERNLQAQKAYKYGKKFTERGDKLDSQGKNPFEDNKTMKYMKKAEKAVDEVERYSKEANNAQLLQQRIVNKALSQGYSFESKEVKRFAQTGGQLTAQYLFGVPGQVAYVTKNRKQLSVKGSVAKFKTDNQSTSSSVPTSHGSVPFTSKQTEYMNKQIGRLSEEDLNKRKYKGR